MDGSVLTDEELQALVRRLQGDARDKNSHLRAVQSEIQAIRDQIEERNKDRQLFTSKSLYINEAAELVAEHEQLRKSLHCKQTELRNLQEGTVQKQRELDEAREELQKMQNYQLHVTSLRQQNMSSIEELKRQYKETQKMCEAIEQQLKEVKQELCTGKDNGTREKQHRKPLSVRLDHFITKSCRQAGLQL